MKPPPAPMLTTDVAVVAVFTNDVTDLVVLPPRPLNPSLSALPPAHSPFWTPPETPAPHPSQGQPSAVDSCPVRMFRRPVTQSPVVVLPNGQVSRFRLPPRSTPTATFPLLMTACALACGAAKIATPSTARATVQRRTTPIRKPSGQVEDTADDRAPR